jgi:hypothetical protein
LHSKLGQEEDEPVESDDEEDLVKNPPKVLGQGARVMIKSKKQQNE